MVLFLQVNATAAVGVGAGVVSFKNSNKGAKRLARLRRAHSIA